MRGNDFLIASYVLMASLSGMGEKTFFPVRQYIPLPTREIFFSFTIRDIVLFTTVSLVLLSTMNGSFIRSLTENETLPAAFDII